MEVTAIGDAVNVASRLEGRTKVLGVSALASEASMRDARHEHHMSLRRVGAVRVKGRNEAVDPFELLDCVSSVEERAQKEAVHERFFQGLLAFMQSDLARAERYFAAASAEAPLDGVSRAYLARTREYLADGLPRDFDGDLGRL